ATEAVVDCRAGNGPVLLEALTYRWQGHYEGDPQSYKPEEEAAAWKERDPLLLAKARIEELGLATASGLEALVVDAEARVDQAESFARASEYPGPDEILTDVYAG